MNILFLYSSEFLQQKGGVQRVTCVLTKYFKKKGHQVIYLSSQRTSDCNESANHQFFLPNLENLNCRENINYYVELVKMHNIDVVINQGGLGPSFSRFCLKIKEYLDVKVISVIHNSLLGNVLNFTSSHEKEIKKIGIPYLLSLLKTNFVSKILKKVYLLKYKKHYTLTCKKYDKLVLLSEEYFPELEDFVPNFDLSKVTAIQNPCTIEGGNGEFVKGNELLYVGRINTAQKRVDLLLEIWSRIQNKYPHWNLSIVGDGVEKKELELKSIKLGLERIKFHGIQNPLSFYQGAKILCMTSSYEGFPLVLVEAQKFGTVPIAFDSFASIKDVVTHDKTGVLVEPFDINSYVEELSKLMDNEQRICVLSQNCKSSVDRYSVEKIGERWIELFENLLN